MNKSRFLTFYSFLICTLCAGSIIANTNSQSAKLNSAIVYLSGAELKHSTSVSLTGGENTVVIKDLSPELDRASLLISASNGAIINSFDFRTEEILDSKTIAPKLKLWNDSLKMCNERIEEIRDLQKVNEQILALMNKESTSSTGSVTNSYTDLIKYTDYLKTKSIDIYTEQRNYKKQLEQLQTVKRQLQRKINEETTQNSTQMGVLTLQLMAPKAITSHLDIKYYTQNAGWAPFYDINVPSFNDPIKIISKANIVQTTGLDWNKVKISLSTQLPFSTSKAPVLNTWFLGYKEQANPNWLIGSGVSPKMYMQRTSNDPESANIIQYDTKNSEVSTPLYIIDGIPSSAAEYTQIVSDMIKSEKYILGQEATALYGNNASNGAIVVTTKKEINDFINQSDNDMGQLFEIDMPYTIQGNGKAQTILLKEQTVKPDFKFYAAPKLSPQVYLLAEISDWQKLGLLTGRANISYAGTYIGETQIDSHSTKDKLQLMLGADDRISIVRTKLQDYSSKKFLGNDIKQEFMYQITVRNNRQDAIKLILEDQYPIPKDQDIKVELAKDMTKPNEVNEGTGILRWNIDLPTGKTEHIKLGYSVKYPKDKDIDM